MKKYIKASNSSVSGLAKFLEESVDTLIATASQYNDTYRYDLDENWAVYVGWSDAGYDEDDESVIHDADAPNYVICCKIASTQPTVWGDWVDYDYLEMPYDDNDEYGDVWDTDMGISPEENYQQTAKWLLDQYNELIRQIESGEFVPHQYN